MISAFEAIAEDLAGRGFAVTDQFLSQNEVRAILELNEFVAGEESFRKAAIGKQQRQINEGIRGDYIQWLDKAVAPSALSLYLDRVEGLMKYLNQSLFLSLKDYEVHITVYPVGTFYKRHLDQFRKDDHRKLSIICYLNENWKSEHGGQLRIYPQGDPIDIFPEAGKLVCFRSDQLEHEVLPATRQRFSITGWILDQLGDLRHL